jgi:hypothetical protein
MELFMHQERTIAKPIEEVLADKDEPLKKNDSKYTHVGRGATSKFGATGRKH